jgi:hypothetical protein
MLANPWIVVQPCVAETLVISAICTYTRLFAARRPFLKALKSLEMNEDILGFPNIRVLRLRLAAAPSKEISGLRKRDVSR